MNLQRAGEKLSVENLLVRKGTRLGGLGSAIPLKINATREKKAKERERE